MPEIALGEKFSSFDSLKDAIDRYQKANNVQLIVKDSKLLGRIVKTMPKLMDVVNKDIVYYRLAYACEYHGEFRSKGKEKPNHISKRRGCPMRILLRLAEDLHHLVVYEMLEQHNHPLEMREETKVPKQQMFRMARVNSSHYMLTKLEEGEGGQMVDIETSFGTQIFEDEEGHDVVGSPDKASSSNDTTTPRLIGNATKRLLTPSEMKTCDAMQDLKRKKLALQNRKLELEAKKLELENRKLEMELKLLEKRFEEGEQNVNGNTYYVSHVIDEKDNITDGTPLFSTSAAEVIKSLTGRGQPFQIITQ
ncbi:hypothetical protein BgiMline_028341 [Biomphalaria glabrata]|uniref:Uncharacterized protein LOC106062487 n=1 Tax=Biomphalaria glabrata TaxID=6526 RepID=A0A2C9M1S9_BIOGL|nr:uncharacterized protein LOC106062487 [Biomphalaria glabrata]KAI8749033.1 hypothetical protein BgiBS90_032463 [Biomphalaria glabrata]KAI8753591.1 hypothetical protein BgiMline_014146 [Biomphalaria glabrata]